MSDKSNPLRVDGSHLQHLCDRRLAAFGGRYSRVPVPIDDVWLENKITLTREDCGVVWPSFRWWYVAVYGLLPQFVHVDDHGILTARIVIGRIEKRTLKTLTVRSAIVHQLRVSPGIVLLE